MANIMIVDDSILIRNKLKAMLVKRGHRIVAEAENGVQAVRRFREYSPDILTMDITMPEMDGISALKKILEIDKDAKVIMLSAISQKLLVLDALKSGAKHFIVKPIEEGKLEHVIDEVLELNTANKTEALKEAGDKSVKEPISHMPVSEVSTNSSIIFESVRDTVVVKFVRNPSEEDISIFMLTMNGILNIKHMNVMLDFEGINDLSEEFSKAIDRILGKFSAAAGEFTIVSINDALKACIHKLNLQYLR